MRRDPCNERHLRDWEFKNEIKTMSQRGSKGDKEAKQIVKKKDSRHSRGILWPRPPSRFEKRKTYIEKGH